MTNRFFFTFLIFLGQTLFVAAGDSGPLPELDQFLLNMRSHLHSNWAVQSQYTYIERLTVRDMDAQGRLKGMETKTYEVYPSADEQFTYKKQILGNGNSVAGELSENADRAPDKKLQEWQRRMKLENPDQKRRRQEKERETARKEAEAVDEAFRLYRIDLIGREQMEGVPVIVLSFERRPDYEPRTDGGKILKNVKGKIWVSEKDYEYVRIEAELMDKIAFGLGFVVRLEKGTRMIFQRSKIDNEAWLPVVSHFVGKGKVLLLKGFRIDRETVYSSYEKRKSLTEAPRVAGNR